MFSRWNAVLLSVVVSAFFWAGCNKSNGGVEEPCVPECGDIECGEDPVCGEVCGFCEAHEVCNEGQLCECVPDCSNLVCGTDPACFESCGDCNEVVLANGGFGLPVQQGVERPPFWYVGFRGEPEAASGTWAIDTSDPAEGEGSLMIEPAGDFFVSQILHLPAPLIRGRTVSLSLSVKHESTDTPPTFFVAGFNPEVTQEHPLLGPGIAGAYVSIADEEEGVWKEYAGQFTADHPATAVVVILFANGSNGRVWFDDVRVVADTWSPGEGPDPESIDTPLDERSFAMGFTGQSPKDLSELGFSDLVEKTAATGEILNLFFHVRWCAHDLSVIPCEDDPVHALMVDLGREARSHGLDLAITVDFTHNSFEEIGELNPLPDGASVGTLEDPAVRAAYREELLWIFDRLEPEFVIVGIEVDIMYEKNPDSWDDFVTMNADVYDAVKGRAAETHVTAYFTLDWMVDRNGELDEESAEVWRMLLPKLDSIAYSTYPNVSLQNMDIADYPPGYFIRAAEVASELPIMIPEFGMVGGGGSSFTEAEQAWVLRTMLSEFSSIDTAALIWYSAYDQPFFGQVPWFKEAFSFLGLMGMDATPKESFVVWQKTGDIPLQ